MLQGKKIAVGVCGGIAAYKAVELVSLLTKQGAQVTVLMTEHAQQFVSKLTFQTISKQTVYTDMFREVEAWDVSHISVAKANDLFILVPATANLIGKIAGGIADDFLTTTVMATKAKVLIAPAMNTNMFENPIVQANIEKLKDFGYEFVSPVSGNLACGDVGNGKLAPVEQITAQAERLLYDNKDLTGLRVLISAGPTKEYIDPVRFLSNDSSGKMGYAVAKAASLRGAAVTLVSGPVSLEAPAGVERIIVTSADEMYEACMKACPAADIIVKAAAVSDGKAKYPNVQKTKKEEMTCIELEQNPDILKAVAQENQSAAIVGFCMETQDLEAYAKKKLETKRADLIVANSLTDEGAGFGTDTNVVKFVSHAGVESLPLLEKEELAHRILDRAKAIRMEKQQG